MQRGITGDVKFTLSGYRNITNLNVKEISGSNEYQVILTQKYPLCYTAVYATLTGKEFELNLKQISFEL